MCVRAESLNSRLDACGWPSAFINGSRDQTDRLSAMAKLKKFQCRVLISTDLVQYIKQLIIMRQFIRRHNMYKVTTRAPKCASLHLMNCSCFLLAVQRAETSDVSHASCDFGVCSVLVIVFQFLVRAANFRCSFHLVDNSCHIFIIVVVILTKTNLFSSMALLLSS